MLTSKFVKELSEEEKIYLLPPSCMQIYFLLQNKKLTFSEINQKLNYSDRTIRTALKTLVSLDLVEKSPMLTDTRKSYYLAKILA